MGLAVARKARVRRQRQDEEEVDAARKKRRLTEAEECLFSLLAERIKSPYTLSWEDARTMLAESKEFRDCDLREDDQERVWVEYTQSVTNARQQAFIRHLGSAGPEVIGPEMTFEEVFERAMDPATTKALAGLPEDLLRSAWREWREQTYGAMVEVCRQWMQSCGHFAGTEGIDPADETAIEALVARLG